MTIESSSFYQKQTLDVTVDIDNEKLHGNLEFGGFGIPTFSLKDYASPVAPVFFSYVSNNTELTCTSLSDNQTYTLHKTDLNEGVVFADFITKGKQQQQFDKFELHLTGLSVWIEGQRGSSLNRDCIERNFNTEVISEPFCFCSVNYILSTNYHIETRNETPVKGLYTIEHTLVIQKMGGYFSFEECKKVSHELRNLFSLLVGNSLSVIEVWILNNKDPIKSLWLYFPTVLYAKEPLRHAFDALCDFSELNDGNKWPSILFSYFNKEVFRNIWSRIVPSYGKMGAWEYDILSRVVMLEMYAGVKTGGVKLKLGKRLNNEFKKELEKTINDFASAKKISGTDQIVFEGMKKSILDTKNTSLPTLREKYEALMGELSPAFKKAISFSEDDFSRIKKLRDSTAHGLDYERHSDGEDITHEMQLSDRLLVLLMCFVYLELGLTETEIATSLQASHCRFIGSAGLNNRELSRISGSAIFITLTHPLESLLLKSYEFVVVEHSIVTDTWRLNEEITHKLRTEWLTSGLPSALDYVKSIVPYQKEQTFDLIQRAYIERQGVETEHYLTVVIHS